jgi:hypothetical protein
MRTHVMIGLLAAAAGCSSKDGKDRQEPSVNPKVSGEMADDKDIYDGLVPAEKRVDPPPPPPLPSRTLADTATYTVTLRSPDRLGKDQHGVPEWGQATIEIATKDGYELGGWKLDLERETFKETFPTSLVVSAPAGLSFLDGASDPVPGQVGTSSWRLHRADVLEKTRVAWQIQFLGEKPGSKTLDGAVEFQVCPTGGTCKTEKVTITGWSVEVD